MKFYKYPLIIFILFVFAQRGFTQSYIFKHITTRDGLAGQLVTGFTQDKNGFIWITTGGGLQRFDGENFITYRHDEKDTASIAFDEVFLPGCDKENNIWVKTPSADLQLLNTRTGKIRRLHNPDIHATYEDYCIYCKDANGDMWLCSSHSVYHYNYKEKKTEKIGNFPDSLVTAFIFPMLRDPITGHLWIGTKTSLIECDPQKKAFHTFRFNPDGNPLLALRSAPFKILLDRQRNLWVATWDGPLYRFSFPDRSLKQIRIPLVSPAGKANDADNAIAGLVQDKHDDIWIAAQKGAIFKYNKQTDALAPVNQFSAEGVPGITGLHDMFVDKDGNIWFGTDYGIYIFNPDQQKIFSFHNNLFSKLSFPARTVMAFCETSKGLIWVSSHGGGLSVFNEQMHLIRRLYYPGDVAGKAAIGKTIWSICEDHSGKVWMAAGGLIICYDPATNTSSFLQMPLIDFAPYVLKADAEGSLWIGGGLKLIKLNPVTKSFTAYTTPPNTPTLFEIRDMLITDQQYFWLATRNGLFGFDPKSGKFIHQPVPYNITGGKSYKNDVLSLAPYDDKTLLLGTGEGLLFFEIPANKFSKLNYRDGDLSNVIQGVNYDNKGNIFTATYNGLYKIDAATHAFTHYDYEDGITDDQFYTHIYRLRDGRMLAGGLNTFVYFDPSNISETYTPPDIQITGFKIFTKLFTPQMLADGSNTIRLKPDQNFISIQYASLHYNSPEEIHYYYMLEGVDRKWVSAGNSHTATYTALGDGKYTFNVRCINDDGIASKNISSLLIVIASPWYKAWWFILLCAAAMAAIAYTIYEYRAQSRRALAMVRGRIASDLHDDLGSTLNSISIYSEVAGQLLQTNTEKARTILETMGGASRSMIDNMNDIVWSINPKNDDFENILQRMQYFAAELLSAKNMLLQFDVDENVKKIKLPMDKRKNFYLVYKEAINNACKYSESKNVDVSIAEKDKNLVMIITDNGQGFDQPKNGLGGNGLNNMKARAAEMGAQLEVSSWPGKGTRVYLKIRV